MKEGRNEEVAVMPDMFLRNWVTFLFDHFWNRFFQALDIVDNSVTEAEFNQRIESECVAKILRTGELGCMPRGVS